MLQKLKSPHIVGYQVGQLFFSIICENDSIPVSPDNDVWVEAICDPWASFRLELSLFTFNTVY